MTQSTRGGRRGGCADAGLLPMKEALRLLAILLLLACSGPARAQWERVTETQEMSLYVAPSSITRNGNTRRFWQLSDYKSPDGNGDRSARVLTEFDCKKQRTRSLKWAYFRGPMGSREMTAWRTKPERWMPVEPGTLGQSIGRLVCGA
jgi:hypothetical protein